ncbi:MAG: hypothetical protein JEZ06_18955 [Anaerolineaceae bacterium]|nr:hypothetical protein [Anaerolineaceae bacterium]
MKINIIERYLRKTQNTMPPLRAKKVFHFLIILDEQMACLYIVNKIAHWIPN